MEVQEQAQRGLKEPLERRIATLQAENERRGKEIAELSKNVLSLSASLGRKIEEVTRLREAVSLARKRLCRYCADENYEDRGPDSVGVGGDYWHWGIGTGEKPPCDAADIRRAALAPEKE